MHVCAELTAISSRVARWLPGGCCLRPLLPTTTVVQMVAGIGTIKELEHAYRPGVRSVRVATHCTEADVSTARPHQRELVAQVDDTNGNAAESIGSALVDGRPARQGMGQETVGEEHHGAALIASVGVLFDNLLAPLTRMVGHQAGMSGDETENADVGPLPFTPWASQVNGLSPMTDLVFPQHYSFLGVSYVASGFRQRQSFRFAPRAFVHVVDGSPKMRELRFGTSYHPRASEAAFYTKGNLCP